jgi:serine-type D-Ala-D-Ala carboxypeptidase (penicillin-binding protein 5/6)
MDSLVKMRTMIGFTLVATLMVVGVAPARGDTNAAPELSARAAFVEQVDTDAVLFEREADTRVPIASLAKLMTGLLVCKYADPADTLVISPYALSQLGRMGGFRTGEVIRVEDVLGLTIVESSNDGATALAEYFTAKRGLLSSGTDSAERRFVEAMNREAGDMGLSNIHFANPHGMDDEEGYISARDAARLFKAFIQYPLLLKIAGTREYECTSTDGTIRHRARNTNLMLDPARGILAGKTGTTKEAGEHLVVLWQPAGSLDRNIVVVLGSTNRYADTEAILKELQAAGAKVEP